MAKQFVANEVLQMAVQLEKRGQKFYETILNSIQDVRARELFTTLRDDEIKHAAHFKDMLDKLEPEESNPDDKDIKTVAYFRSLVETKVFPEGTDTDKIGDQLGDPAAGIRIALTLEKDAVLFFHEMLAVAHHSDEPVLKHIIDEERDHILRILKIKQQFGI